MAGDPDDPDDLGARVLAARGRSVVEPPPEVPRRAGRLGWGTVAVLAAATVVLVFALRRSVELGSGPGGAISARERTEISLARAGAAVLEPEASIDWAVEGGDLRIGHRRGEVFYRIDRGGFAVSGEFGRLSGQRASFTLSVKAGVSLRVHQGQLSLRCGARSEVFEAGSLGYLPPCDDPG